MNSGARKQRGFTLFYVLIVIAMVASFAYVRLLDENSAAHQAKADRVAVQLLPAVQAYMEYLSNHLGTMTGSEFYDDYDLLSEEYAATLLELGYDTGPNSTTLTVTSTQTVT